MLILQKANSAFFLFFTYDEMRGRLKMAKVEEAKTRGMLEWNFTVFAEHSASNWCVSCKQFFQISITTTTRTVLFHLWQQAHVAR